MNYIQDTELILSKEKKIYHLNIDENQIANDIILVGDQDRVHQISKNFETKCIEAFLVKVGDYSGGSMGWDISYGIYGLYNINGLGKSVLPLKYFSSKNEALNFFD